jgi:hypothetical protein
MFVFQCFVLFCVLGLSRLFCKLAFLLSLDWVNYIFIFRLLE